VDVDGRRIGALRQYRSVDVELPPGRHTVAAHMDGVRSATLDVDLADGQQLHLEVALPLLSSWDLLQRPQRALAIRPL
jgi:hypothetical protein